MVFWYELQLTKDIMLSSAPGTAGSGIIFFSFLSCLSTYVSWYGVLARCNKTKAFVSGGSAEGIHNAESYVGPVLGGAVLSF